MNDAERSYASTFDQEIETGPVLVDFYSKNCGSCKMLDFILQDLDQAYEGEIPILKVDFEANPELVDRHQVEGYPTVIAFKDGVEQDRRAGLVQKTH